MGEGRRRGGEAAGNRNSTQESRRVTVQIYEKDLPACGHLKLKSARFLCTHIICCAPPLPLYPPVPSVATLSLHPQDLAAIVVVAAVAPVVAAS